MQSPRVERQHGLTVVRWREQLRASGRFCWLRFHEDKPELMFQGAALQLRNLRCSHHSRYRVGIEQLRRLVRQPPPAALLGAP
jgi:hypothetical protein